MSIVARGTKQGLYPAKMVRLYRCWWSGCENVCHGEEADGHREHTEVYSCRIADTLPLRVIMSKSTVGATMRVQHVTPVMTGSVLR